MRTTFPVEAPPAAWAAIADPIRLAAMLPGCRSVTRDADRDGTLHVVAELAVASVRGLWAGTVVPVDADAVRVTASGAPGSVDLIVRAAPDRTTLTVEGTVDGAIGTVGSAVLAAAVRRTAEDLLAAAADGPPDPGVPPSVSPPAPGRHRSRRRRLLGAGAAAVAGVLIVARRRRARRPRGAG